MTAAERERAGTKAKRLLGAQAPSICCCSATHLTYGRPTRVGPVSLVSGARDGERQSSLEGISAKRGPWLGLAQPWLPQRRRTEHSSCPSSAGEWMF